MPADNMQANMAADITGSAKQLFPLRIALAGLTGADVLTSLKPGFAFEIVKVSFAVITAVTTAAKLATLTPKISGEAITGGVLSLTSDACTPKGTVLDATEITPIPLGQSGTNQGSADDSISLTASDVTAFAEGDGDVVFLLRNREAGIPPA